LAKQRHPKQDAAFIGFLPAALEQDQVARHGSRLPVGPIPPMRAQETLPIVDVHTAPDERRMKQRSLAILNSSVRKTVIRHH
jgi:hypothetical protein